MAKGATAFEAEPSATSPPPRSTLLIYLAIITAAIAANMNVCVKPMETSGYVQFLSFSASQAGFIVGAEAASTSLATAVTALWLREIPITRMMIAAFAIILLGNLVSIEARHFVPLMFARIFTGLGHGAASAISAAAVVRLRSPERISGLVAITVNIAAVGLIIALPATQAVFGLAPLFAAMALLTFPALALLRWLPSYANISPSPNLQSMSLSAVRSSRRTCLLTLGAVAFFYLSAGSFWPFAGQIGRSEGLKYNEVATVIAVATFLGASGGLAGVAFGSGLGQVMPAAFAFAGAITSQILILTMPGHPMLYAVSVSLYYFSWGTLYPFLMGFAARLDPRGKMNSLMYCVGLSGLAIGPNLGSLVITLGASNGNVHLQNVVIMSLLCLMPASLLVVIMSRFFARAQLQDRVEATTKCHS